MTSSQHAPYVLGYTRNTMGETIRSDLASASESAKLILSSDCRLQLAYMKPESLVIASQLYAVNTFLNFVHTARHTTKVMIAQSRYLNLFGGGRLRQSL